MLRILIVEREYLIAIDAERILTDAFDCRVTIAKAQDMAEILRGQRFDIVVFDFSDLDSPTIAALQQFIAEDYKLAFTTTDDTLAAGVPGFENCPVLLKPYQERQLVELISKLTRA